MTRALFLLLAILLSACQTPEPPAGDGTPVHFAVDMRAELADGSFDVASDVVGVRGSVAPLAWDVPVPLADEDGDSIYTTTVRFADTVAVQRVEYKFKIDDPTGSNDGWEAGRNRLLTPADSSRISRRFDAPPPVLPPTFTGTVEVMAEVTSAFLPETRPVYVYLPPGYTAEPDRRYPVLYMHDGQNVFDANARGSEWGVDETAERLIRAGAIEPLIVVGVGNTAARISEYTPVAATPRQALPRTDAAPTRLVGTYGTPETVEVRIMRTGDGFIADASTADGPQRLTPNADSSAFTLSADAGVVRFSVDASGRADSLIYTGSPEGGAGPAYARFLVDELKPMIDDRYRTQTGPGATGVAGSSLGGLISMYLALARPATFTRIGVLSPSVWWADDAILRLAANAPYRGEHRIWLDMGTGEGDVMVRGARRLRDTLQARGWTVGDNLRYVEIPDAPHHESAWAERVEPMLRFLFPPASAEEDAR